MKHANRAEMQKQIKKASMSLDSVRKKIDFEALRITPPQQEDIAISSKISGPTKQEEEIDK